MTKKRRKPDAAPTSEGTETIAAVTGVTYATYKDQGAAFVQAQGRCFTIARDGDAIDLPIGFEPTPKQWTAWMEYFQAKYDADRRPNFVKNRRSNRIAVMLRHRGWGAVPTEWPHQFDAEWQKDWDNAAGNRGWDKHQAWLAKRPTVATTPEEIARRAAFTSKAWPHERKRTLPPKPLDAETQTKLDDGTWSIADLKTPPAPPRSTELKRLLDRSEGL